MNRFIFLFFALSALTGCASPLRGTVIEKGTEKPVEGAIVYAQWMSYGGFIDSRTSCVQIDFSTTDANGRYELPNLNASDTLKPHLGVYKPGYEEYLDVDIVSGRITPYPGTPSGEEWLVMRPFTGTTEERLKYLIAQHGKECGPRSEYVHKLIPFYRRLNDEARSIAKTPAEKKGLWGFQYAVDILELGFPEASRKLSNGEYK